MKFPHIPSVVDTSDMRVFKDLLIELSKTRNYLDILEYGAGYSAIYYPLFMLENGIEYEWHSVENTFDWTIKLNALIKQYGVNSKIWYCGVNTKSLKKCRNNPAKIRYARHPDIIKKKFDLIYVDGRIRNRCLVRCPSYLNPGGVILLDNANRKKYRPGMKKYKGEFIKPWIWRTID